MKLGIHLHVSGLSLSNTVLSPDTFGVEHAQSTVHYWLGESRLTADWRKSPDHVTIDETVIQLNNQRYLLYTAVDAATKKYLHVRLFSTRIQTLTELFLRELREKHHVEAATFLVDGAPWFQAAPHHHGRCFQHQTHWNRNAAERIFKELKCRTNQFRNHFWHAEPATVETWL